MSTCVNLKCFCVSQKYTLDVELLCHYEKRQDSEVIFFLMASMALYFCKQKTVCFSLRLKVTTVAGYSLKETDIC